jgi:hypothetical protein
MNRARNERSPGRLAAYGAGADRAQYQTADQRAKLFGFYEQVYLLVETLFVIIKQQLVDFK